MEKGEYVPVGICNGCRRVLRSFGTSPKRGCTCKDTVAADIDLGEKAGGGVRGRRLW